MVISIKDSYASVTNYIIAHQTRFCRMDTNIKTYAFDTEKLQFKIIS